jgi:TatD DNase family protein
MLVDSHCHLDHSALAKETDAVVERARRAGIGRLVTINTRVSRFAEVRAIAEQYPEVFCSVGTHPHHAAEEPDLHEDILVEIAAHPKVVAIGEAGLDYFYQHSPPEAQAKGFRVHAAAARATGLPLVIHTRDADEDIGRLLEEETSKGKLTAILHCFTGGAALARKAVAMGHYVSFSGILTFKKSASLREIATELPEDRLLVETDAPFLAPEPWRGKRNEPAYIAETARVLAETRGVALERIAEATTANFFRVFSKVPR